MTFAPNSRYQGIATAKLVREDGCEVAYLKQRFVPDPARFTLLAEHVVAEGDRLDNIAAVMIGDAELAWRIADASRAMRPGALTERIGRRLRVTLPEALGGPPLV
jgi:hypothetical protein